MGRAGADCGVVCRVCRASRRLRPGGGWGCRAWRDRWQRFARLAPLGMAFDAWLLAPQLPELIALARAFPAQPIILDHVGTPLGLASYQGRLGERFGVWRDNIRELAKSPLVNVKLGGLAMAFPNFPSFLSDPPALAEMGVAGKALSRPDAAAATVDKIESLCKK